MLAEKMPSSGSVTNQKRSERPESHLMRFEDVEARRQGEDEAVTPPAGRHIRGLARIVGRQFVIERGDHGLLAREVAIQEADADTRLRRDIPKGCRFVTARGNQLHSGRVQAVPGLGTLGCLASGTAPFSRLDIFCKHVH